MRSDDPKLDCRFGYDDERTEHSEAGSAHLWAVQVADTHANLRPTHIHTTHTNGIRYKHTRSSYSVMSEDLLRSIWYIYEQYMRKWPPSSTSKQPVWKPPKNKFIIYYVSCSGCAVLCRGTVHGASANIYTYIYIYAIRGVTTMCQKCFPDPNIGYGGRRSLRNACHAADIPKLLHIRYRERLSQMSYS